MCLLYVKYVLLHLTCLHFHTSSNLPTYMIVFLAFPVSQDGAFYELLHFISSTYVGPILSCPMVSAFGIQWPQTAAGETVMPGCTNGTAKRSCRGDGQWEEPDLSDCVSKVSGSIECMDIESSTASYTSRHVCV